MKVVKLNNLPYSKVGLKSKVMFVVQADFNPFALRKAKIVINFALSECKGLNIPAAFLENFIICSAADGKE